MKFKVVISILLTASLVAACNLPAATPESNEGIIFTLAAQTITAAAQGNGTTPIPQTATMTNTPPAAAATTQAPPSGAASPTNTSQPCNMASFVEDVTIDDNENITVNTAFTKTWRLKNVGSCTWTSGYQLVFDSGDQMSGPSSQQLTTGTVAPGQTIDVSVNLTAPSNPGTYKGNWKIKEPGGVVFGLSTGPFWVQIKAVAAADYPTFKKGDTGEEVYAIQYLLIARGFNLNADGIFGNETQSKVEDFQTQNNLSEDGIVGPVTWKALIIQAQQGKSGEEVRAIQKLLKDKFGYNIAVDGIFGPATSNAVKDFQSAKGLAADGIVGPLTWQKLINK